jgi:hypothetical protein
MRRAFDDLTESPCPVCVELATRGAMQWRAIMPLPSFPARLRADGRQCCRDCQATETTMAMRIGQHPEFESARLTVANERIEGLAMPLGLMEHMGMCEMGFVDPCSIDDIDRHTAWLDRHVPDVPFEERGSV